MDKCKFFKGEQECPEAICNAGKAMFWEYERIWCSMRDTYEMCAILDAYLDAGLEDFDPDDGTPMTLKALLFNRYEHWCQGTPDGFKDFYKCEYK